ncbi:two-component SAPR family response regulator [Paenibacillus rhizosphaerae]|uniref:Two-component SAPR family response regulator n=1 Tax=Paenibacillus rhizosphaerae TaxID=297318 RepID=A0A839TY35_9BACL|nr:response regulator [Paenibacillus rhizosphaerae]MBB3131552.1 two-component SAPR family response regulator [Paenibacillus rhizosphaerae]
MKIILVDDEYLALKKMERLLQSLEGVNLEPLSVRAFQSPLQALDAAAEDAPDLAFLDIDMPEMTGFELADRLFAMYPGLEVVFVTAYQEFAIKAFEINALDYLLKPIHPNRLDVTMKRVASSPPADTPSEEGRPRSHMMLCCLKNLHFRSAGGKVQSFSWRTLKAPELFAYLIYYRNKTVSKQTLIDLLWPDFNLKRATTQLHTAIYQIRKTIKTSGIDLHIKFQDEGYRLEFGNVTLDIEDWEKALRSAPPVDPESLPEHIAIMDKYPGDFLEEHGYGWAEPEQERTRLLWFDQAKRIAECCIHLGQQAEAIGLYQEMIRKMPYREEGYEGLMKLYASLNQRVGVRRLYQQMTTVFLEDYDMAPSKEILAWFEAWEKERMHEKEEADVQ